MKLVLFQDKGAIEFERINIVCETSEDRGLLSRFYDLVEWLWKEFFAAPDKIWRAFCKGKLRLSIVEEEE